MVWSYPQKNYALNILDETDIIKDMHVDTPIDTSVKYVPNQGPPFSNPRRYKRLVGKLNYLLKRVLTSPL